MNISVFDTSISNYNLGNTIIMDSIYEHLDSIFPRDFIFKIPSAELTDYTISYIQNSDLLFFGGTNSICPKMEEYSQWGITLDNVKYIENFVSVGLGWWQYSDFTSKYTKKLLHKLLLNGYLHAVRDEYTKNKLKEIGINNVINTACPTLWNISNTDINYDKSENAIITLTDYYTNRESDLELINIVKSNYKNIYYWLQGTGDYKYIKELDKDVVDGNIIPPRVELYNTFLNNTDVDYIGTRLHGGIRALQHGKKSFIISVDNRATEMARDFNLPVIERSNLDILNDKINMKYNIDIKIPHGNIRIWKEQFKKYKYKSNTSHRDTNEIKISKTKTIVNTLAWWIPVRKWRNNFRNNVKK